MKTLKPKEKEFAKKYIMNNKNGSKAVKEVFNIKNDSYARLKAHRMITNDNIVNEIEIVQKTLMNALIDKGITPDKIAEKINVLLEASNNQGQKDFTAIDKGIKHSVLIYGVKDSMNKKPNNTTYEFIFSEEVQERIRLINSEIKAKLLGTEIY